MNHCSVTCRERHYFEQCPHEIEGILRETFDSPRIAKDIKVLTVWQELVQEQDRLLELVEKSF